MQRLPGVDDVEDPVCLEVADAVAQRREVRGVVAVAAVALLHHQHGGLAVGGLDLLGLDDHRAVAVRRDARGEQLLDDLGQPLVVERLACRVARLQQHAEPAVDLPEGELGLVHDLAPAPQGRLVACLQGDDPGPGPVGERRDPRRTPCAPPGRGRPAPRRSTRRARRRRREDPSGATARRGARRGTGSASRTACPSRPGGSAGSTVAPRWPSTRASESPMIVVRRCPTCISLAMLGAE